MKVKFGKGQLSSGKKTQVGTWTEFSNCCKISTSRHEKAEITRDTVKPCYIADLFHNMETNQVQEKLDEIEEIGFGFLKLVPKWNVKQGIMVILTKAYDTETSTLKVADGVIRIGPELFERLFRILPGVDDFPPFDAEQAIRKYQRKNNKSCKGYMFALLVLYFQKLKHGDLDNCQEPQPWLFAWNAKELSAMAATIQLEAFSVPGGNDGVVLEGAAEEHTMGTGLNKEDMNHTMSPDGCKKGSDRREGDGDDDDDEPIAKRLRHKYDLKRTPKSCLAKGETSKTRKTERIKNQKDNAITFDEDDDDNQPIGKRICIKAHKSKSQQQKGTERENIATSLPNTSKKPTETNDAEPKTPSNAMIDYSGI
ncbi:uncharacterized protein DS421_2g53640 [Arachis hypogaea]|nr:uncharacterized protein DS421_2g53640 [Arachis hypogaea]